MRMRGAFLGLAVRVAFGLLLIFSADAYAQGLGKFLSPGDLSSLHGEVEGITNCTECHTMGGELPDSLCLECHEDVAERIDANKGYHATVTDKKCFECHSDHKGVQFEMIKWKMKKFDHGDKNTGYALHDKHAKVKCEDCHKAKTKKGAKTFFLNSKECISCHEDIHKPSLGQKCEDCHNEKSWKGSDVRFDHAKSKYPLDGKHAKVKCADCHKVKGIFKVQNFERCVTCHVKEDVHKGSLGQKCADCHNVNSWKKLSVKFNHNKTKYPLKGKHSKVKCDDCHRQRKKGVFEVAKFNTCSASGCHDIPKRGFIHKRQFEDKLCTECHTESGWKPTLFKHVSARYRGFKLEGKHAKVKCEKCHAKGWDKVVKYKPINSQTCDASGCHDTKKRGNIHAKQFKDEKCSDCHTDEGWKPSLFKHQSARYNGYKLHGKHAEVKCEKCHTMGRSSLVHYKPIKTNTCDASGCHDTKAHGNIHGRQFKGQQCQDCHNEEKWKPSLFRHDLPTYDGYKLLGKHAQVKCEKCHKRDAWKPLAQKCLDCHTKDDKHKGRFGLKCEQCHDEKTWKTEKFDHDAIGFNLGGGHKGLRCDDCHQSSKEVLGDGEDCAQCHTDPHFNQFGSFCADCHTAKTWDPTKFRHSHTGFRLEGAHRVTDCESCHQNRFYRNTPVDCYSCHKDNFLASQTSLHSPSSINCEDCHRAYTWNVVGRTKIHSAMTFGGAHKAIENSCNKCHQPGSNVLLYPGATFESDCETCHQADYFRVHANGSPAGLAACPQTCTLCHNTTTFFGARSAISCD